MTKKTAEQDTESNPVNDKEEAFAAPEDKHSPGSETISAADFSDTDAPAEDVQDESADTDLSAVENTPDAEPEPAEEKAEVDEAIVPGSLSRALKKCRENAGLSIEQATQEMRLPLSVVRALEDENFADLPEPPYVRGYLRSYARLSDSDPNNLINRYETLRGADPKDINSYTAPIPRHQHKKSAKKEVSPTTVKLAGFSMIVLLLVVLSMIPAVSQWASDTWKAFSEPQKQQLAINANDENTAGNDESSNADTGSAADSNDVETTPVTAAATPPASSNNDTAAENTEQLTLNNQDSESAATAVSGEDASTDADTTTNNNDAATDENAAIADTADDAVNDTTASQGDESADTTTDQQADGITDESETVAQSTDNALTDPAAADTQNAGSTAQTDASDEASATTDNAEQAAEAESAPTEQTEQTAESETQQQEPAQQEPAQAEPEKEPEQKQEDNFQQPFDGNVSIRLVFSQPVWMSIKDGRGKTIFGALNSAGTVKELKARTPLEFHVGNAPGVQIFLNGQLIDQRPHTRGSVARFRAN